MLPFRHAGLFSTCVSASQTFQFIVVNDDVFLGDALDDRSRLQHRVSAPL